MHMGEKVFTLADAHISLNRVPRQAIGFERGSRKYETIFGGADGSRTHDLLNAIQALSQLSYGPTDGKTEC